MSFEWINGGICMHFSTRVFILNQIMPLIIISLAGDGQPRTLNGSNPFETDPYNIMEKKQTAKLISGLHEKGERVWCC